MQQYTLYLYLQTALRVSGGISNQSVPISLIIFYISPKSKFIVSIIIQQDATIYSLFISVICSSCFGWYLHPSSGAHITVSTVTVSIMPDTVDRGAVLQIGRSLVRSQLVSLEFFIKIISFQSQYGPEVHSASNRNEYQEYFLGGKGGRCVSLTTYHHPVPLS